MNNFGGNSMPPSSNQQDWNNNVDYGSYSNGQSQTNNNNDNHDQPLDSIYVNNMPLYTVDSPTQSHQQYDENGQPIKIRKKPGRKPNPASPALRKAQNRAAQRAFRERKERHLKDLEGTIRQLRDQRNSAVKELNQTKSKMDAFRAENWYLKGVVLTLQFVCLHHNIHIPTHSPYLSEEALSEMAKTTPHAIEAYVNAYTKNNINLKPTMASHFANNAPEKDSPTPKREEEKYESDDELLGEEEEEEEERREYEEEMDLSLDKDTTTIASSTSPVTIKQEYEDETLSQWLKQQGVAKEQRQKEKNEAAKLKQQPESLTNNNSSVSAIQHIRLQLRVQSAVSSFGKSAPRLQPTILQLAIPHDPRIDLIPTPHMRDRMIIFRDQMDYDRCFGLLLGGAVHHGGDPTLSASWELPAEFFTEFWYLAINYDVSRTNTWRRLKGLSEIHPGPTRDVMTNVNDGNVDVIGQQEWFKQQQQQQQQQQYNQYQQHQQYQHQNPSDILLSPPTTNNNALNPQHYHQQQASNSNNHNETNNNTTLWTDDVFAQMTAGMPSLQPLDAQHLTSGFDFGSPTAIMFDDSYKNYYQTTNNNNNPSLEQFIGASSPESRNSARSPSFGAMMDLMHSLSTDMQ